MLSYFTFLKWILQLNIFIFFLTLIFVIIPQAVSTGQELPLNASQNISSLNNSDTNISSSSEMLDKNSSMVAPTDLSAMRTRHRRDIAPAHDNYSQPLVLHCNLVKPENYSAYTNKPFTQLASDFISGVVSTRCLRPSQCSMFGLFRQYNLLTCGSLPHACHMPNACLTHAYRILSLQLELPCELLF